MKKYGLLMLIVMLAFIFGCSDRQERKTAKKPQKRLAIRRNREQTAKHPRAPM
jgi:preprotein translocase subunit YajC